MPAHQAPSRAKTWAQVLARETGQGDWRKSWDALSGVGRGARGRPARHQKTAATCPALRAELNGGMAEQQNS